MSSSSTFGHPCASPAPPALPAIGTRSPGGGRTGLIDICLGVPISQSFTLQVCDLVLNMTNLEYVFSSSLYFELQ